MVTKNIRQRPHRSTNWIELKIGPSSRVYAKPIDRAVLNRMPVTTRTFLNVGMWDLIGMRFRNLFSSSSHVDQQKIKY